MSIPSRHFHYTSLRCATRRKKPSSFWNTSKGPLLPYSSVDDGRTDCSSVPDASGFRKGVIRMKTRFFSRSSAFVAVALVLVLLLPAAPASAARDRQPPTTPTNLRV